MKLHKIKLLFLLGSLLLPNLLLAQTEWGQEYGNRIKNRQTLDALNSGLFGEQVNLFDGTASFSATDINVPGNSSLPVSVTRKLSIGSSHNAADEGLFGDWELAIPYLSNISTTSAGWQAPPDPSFYWRTGGDSPYARCSAPQVPGEGGATDIANSFSEGGELFLLTANTSAKLVRPSIPGLRWVTKNFWYFGCTPSLASGHQGEGFFAIDPSGTKTTFNWMVRSFFPGMATPANGPGQLYQSRSEIRLYPTRVEDRFGNWVQYNWSGRKLLSIVANDARRIDFTYGADDQIISASAHGQTWTYSYNDYASAGAGGSLLSVKNPDNSTWTFSNNPGHYVAYEPRYEIIPCSTPGGDLGTCEKEIMEKVAFCAYDHYLSPRVVPFQIKHPSGAVGEFNFKTMRHGRTNVPVDCVFSWDLGGDGGRTEAQNSNNQYPAFKDVWSIQSKTINGPGLSPATWSYSYANLQACVGNTCTINPQPTRKTVTQTEPDGDLVVSVFGKDVGIDESQLLSVETKRGASVLSRTDYQYVSNSAAANMAFPDLVGTSGVDYPDLWSVAGIRPQRSYSTTQTGDIFSRTTNTFDAFARPLSVTSSSSLGYAKTDATEYLDDLNKWVLGQVKRSINADTNTISSETQYNAQVLPWKTFSFGKLQSTMSYNPDGTLANVADGRGNVTSLSNWKRGIPASIQFPATTEAPTGATVSAQVDDSGWIRHVLNELGAKTCYGYDAMGRINSVIYPSETAVGVCDGSRWNPTMMAFEQVNADEHGLPEGHWRAIRREGNKHTNTYYDAMWRPVLEETLDYTDIAGTLSQVVKKYDASGHAIFQSYPTNNVNHFANATQGVRTFYDGLDRVIKTEQDSELGLLSSSTEYVSGLRTRITNPRGQQMTNSFMAWDQPSYDLAISSIQPEGKVIQIDRHPRFGWPLRFTQRSADDSVQQVRSYVYDGAAQLCKTIEPETGATVMGYDAANNPVWSAAGLTGGSYASISDCNYVAANSSGRVVNRSFDARNKLLSLSFPDGLGNQTWSYEKDGLPASITTYNTAGNTTPVINRYAYNVRRMPTSEYSQQPGWYDWRIGYEYDASANLRWQSYPTGLTLDYAPNALGQATQVKDQYNKTYASGARYFPNGSLKQFTYGNGIVHSMLQNARQLPARVTSSSGVLDFGYSYDANTNISAITDFARGAAFNRAMSYDNLDRLLTAASPAFGGDGTHRYSYDAIDNLKSWKLGGVKDYASYIYDAQHRLTGITNSLGAAVVNLSYDAQGNLANKDGQAFVFDYGNRLRAAPGKESYLYDGLGRRVQTSKADGSLALWQYSGSGQMLFSFDGPLAQKTHENIYFAGSLIAVVDHDWPSNAVLATKYQHTDALGSPIAVTNEAGAVIDRNDYEPYGAIIGKPNFNGIGYTGHVMDGATGLTYMQQRYYDQSIGRFLSVDPVTADAKTGGNFNRYWYANNNPYRFVDPDGRLDLEKLGDSVKVEVGFGLGLNAKARIGPLKGSVGLGEGMWGGGVTLTDVYGFSEVTGPSFAIAVASLNFGRLPGRERSLMGRNGETYQEQKSPGGWRFGFKKEEAKIRDDGTDATVGASASLVVAKVTGSIDFGKMYEAIFDDPAKEEPKPAEHQVKTYRVEGRTDARK